MDLGKILGIDYPIIQGGMANISDGRFAAMVSNEGALGVIGSGGMTKEELRKEIRICKGLTNKPFGVNLMLLNPEVKEMARILIEEGVGVVTTGVGNPGPYIDQWKEAGIKVFPVVSNLSLAIRMERLGVDGIIAEGMEAGGHISSMTTITLVDEMVENLSIPVIGAGGIGSGRQILSVKVLGGVGVQIGSLFLASDECPIHINYKEKILKSSSNNVTVIGQISGLPTRVIKNQMARKYRKMERSGGSKMDLEKYTLGSLRKAVIDGDMENGSIMVGLSVSRIDRIRPIKDILEGLMEEYRMELGRLCDEYKTRE